MIAISKAVGKSISQSVERGNQRRQQPNPLFDRMVEQFEMTSQWPSGKSIRLLDSHLRGRRSMVYLKNIDGWIKLYVYVAGKTAWTSPGFVVGWLSEAGWQLSSNASLGEFNIWHKRQRATITKLEDQKRL